MGKNTNIIRITPNERKYRINKSIISHIKK